MTLRTLSAAALMALAASSPGFAQTVLDKAVISIGGGTTTSSSSRLDATIAEVAVGTASSGQTVGQFGFWTAAAAIPLSAERPGAGAITAVRLAPNPAAEATHLTLTLAAASAVELTLHDAAGRTIGTRSLGRLGAGEHLVPIDLAGLPSGAYSLVASIDGALVRVPVTIVR